MYSPFFEAAATWQRVAMAQMQMMYTGQHRHPDTRDADGSGYHAP